MEYFDNKKKAAIPIIQCCKDNEYRKSKVTYTMLIGI